MDAVNGNDATGLRGDFTKPFLTLVAAKNAANSLDTVHVRRNGRSLGTYAAQPCLAESDAVADDRRGRPRPRVAKGPRAAQLRQTSARRRPGARRRTASGRNQPR